MPLFEFVCDKCKNKFEVLEKIEVNESKCPTCGNVSHKIISKSNWEINGTCFNSLPPKEYKAKEEKKDLKRKILVDLECPKCKKLYDDRFIYVDEVIKEKCEICKVKLKRLFSYGSFELKYDPTRDICDWSGNTSQYWNAVKEERRKGNKVKGAHEQ